MERRRTGALMREILRYLDAEAQKLSPGSSNTDATPYKTARQIANEIGAAEPCVWRSLRILLSQGRIRRWPDCPPERMDETRKRRYGSTLLPAVTYEDIHKEFEMLAAPLVLAVN